MRVLIVENDTTIAENLYTYLELKGFAVDAAYDGNGALALLQDQDFDALVLDLGLPGLDGFGVLQALRQSRQTPIPTLVLTARSQLESKLTAFDLGADDYLIKPFALAEVEARLRALMRRGHTGTARLTALGRSGIQPGFRIGPGKRTSAELELQSPPTTGSLPA